MELFLPLTALSVPPAGLELRQSGAVNFLWAVLTAVQMFSFGSKVDNQAQGRKVLPTRCWEIFLTPQGSLFLLVNSPKGGLDP